MLNHDRIQTLPAWHGGGQARLTEMEREKGRAMEGMRGAWGAKDEAGLGD